MNGKEIFDQRHSLWSAELAKNGHDPVLLQCDYEIIRFIDVLLENLKFRRLALEIGLGFGGSHLLWKQMFQRVVSVTNLTKDIELFQPGLVNQANSSFVLVDSTKPAGLVEIKKAVADAPIDFLFIDGSHQYEDVKSDFLTFAPLVAVGGIVAFHDAAHWNPANSGPAKLIAELRNGHLLVGKSQITLIKAPLGQTHPQEGPCGIAYYKVGG
jgi:predicted O-methyltransferase YrrM